MTQHIDVAGWLLGKLEPVELKRFEEHLATCPRCQREASELGVVTELYADADLDHSAPAGLEQRVLDAVERAAAPDHARIETPIGSPGVGPMWRARRPRVLAAAIGATAALAFAVFLGTRLGGDGAASDASIQGPLVLSGQMKSPFENHKATVAVSEEGDGELIRLDSPHLPYVADGTYYELWFVGPGDRPSSPNRISAGTFVPDPDLPVHHGRAGEVHAEFHAAVDPARYPVLEVTTEPADGNPAATGRAILRLDATAEPQGAG